MSAPLAVSRHACDRWSQRVDRSATTLHAAREAILAMAATGSRSKRPRRWLLHGRGGTSDGIGRSGAQAGAVFIYSMELPGVALLVIDDVVVTVLTRAETKRRRALLAEAWA
jgi:hypothetical protein